MEIPGIMVPLLVSLIGAVVYGLADGKSSLLGKDMFWVGLLVALMRGWRG